MRKILQFGIVVGVLAVLVQPAQGKVYMDYKFPDGSVWQIGGFETYNIIQRGVEVGKARVDYSKITMLDQPATRIIFTQSWTDSGVLHKIDIDSKMLANGFAALMSTRTEKVGEEEWRYEGNYSGKKMTFNAFLPGDPQVHQYGMDKTKQCADVEALPFLLRNIPFADRNFVTFPMIDVAAQTSFTPIISVTGSEVVDTGLAQYDCWVVNVSLPDSGFTAWYSKSDRHYLVKIRYEDREVLLHRHS